MSEPHMIYCESLVKIYRLSAEVGSDDVPEVQALQGLDLIIDSGEMVGIVGASGSGKSTLMNILGGLDSPTGGKAIVDGHDLGRMSSSALDNYRRRTVGFVWQQGARNLLPYLSASENILLPMTLLGRANRQSKVRSDSLLELVGLRDRSDHKLSELSGGEQQRVAVAIALANQPRLLLTDEPTGELDTDTAQMVYDLLRNLNKSLGLTILIVSHDPGIARHVDRVVAVRDGKLASETLRVRVSHDGDHEAHHFEELVILDSAGRVQIPRDHLEKFNIHKRARLEITEEGILLRPPADLPPEKRNENKPVDNETAGESPDVDTRKSTLYSQSKHMISKAIRNIWKPGKSDGRPNNDSGVK